MQVHVLSLHTLLTPGVRLKGQNLFWLCSWCIPNERERSRDQHACKSYNLTDIPDLWDRVVRSDIEIVRISIFFNELNWQAIVMICMVSREEEMWFIYILWYTPFSKITFLRVDMNLTNLPCSLMSAWIQINPSLYLTCIWKYCQSLCSQNCHIWVF